MQGLEVNTSHLQCGACPLQHILVKGSQRGEERYKEATVFRP